ncbi:YfcL family protein [Arsenophonus nasoniae]|uniref:YfcL family protein n=1 Tax=Arsenophonus nasoniae TaxID=638 RepID=D2U4C1_9GAMM|nr:YfcL family protein [Arsenophonus nasoniae]QBY44106.1 YfcL protein [Arsenophonus nasoniae]WGM00478.1 YfcL family protein [Arsenophonus nasoniae]WGM04409.1 YfcL family protein [Arsenophonus nasoniae]WGM09513.1 YfcL family protein [Arsenophonus nasoniae]WGM14234.1 YfcL family protein [Arsenophonus nasoniae]
MLAELETRILTQIDNDVDNASQDELFAGGYLRGHLILAIAELEAENKNNIAALSDRVEQSIDKAIKAGELSPPDQRLILNTWRKLLENALQ